MTKYLYLLIVLMCMMGCATTTSVKYAKAKVICTVGGQPVINDELTNVVISSGAISFEGDGEKGTVVGMTCMAVKVAE